VVGLVRMLVRMPMLMGVGMAMRVSMHDVPVPMLMGMGVAVHMAVPMLVRMSVGALMPVIVLCHDSILVHRPAA
jgi:hypothetical protein